MGASMKPNSQLTSWRQDLSGSGNPTQDIAARFYGNGPQHRFRPRLAMQALQNGAADAPTLNQIIGGVANNQAPGQRLNLPYTMGVIKNLEYGDPQAAPSMPGFYLRGQGAPSMPQSNPAIMQVAPPAAAGPGAPQNPALQQQLQQMQQAQQGKGAPSIADIIRQIRMMQGA